MIYEITGSCNHIHTFDLRKFEGRVFFATDLHGCYDLLHEKLILSGFDSTRDLLLLGGDMCDRGPDSKYVLDYLEEPWIHSIRGNHEQIFIDAYDDNWVGSNANCLFGNGGDWVKELDVGHAKVIYQTFKSLPVAFELLLPTETVGIIHANVPYNDWDQFKKITKAELEWDGLSMAQWDRDRYRNKDTTIVKGIDRVYVGHNPTKSGEIEVLGNVYHCDLGSFFRDKIAFVEITQ